MSTTAYPVILTVAGFIDGAAFSFTPLPDATVISFFAFLDGLSVIVHDLYGRRPKLSGTWNAPISLRYRNVAKQDPTSVPVFPLSEGDEDGVEGTSFDIHSTKHGRQSRLRRYGCTAFRVSNRILMVIHAAVLILSMAGAVELALAYRFANPYVKR